MYLCYRAFWKRNAIKREKNAVVVTQDGGEPIPRSSALPVVTKFPKDVRPAFFRDHHGVEALIAKLDEKVVFGEASLTDGHDKFPKVLTVAVTATWSRRMSSGVDPRLNHWTMVDGEWHRACNPP